MLCFTSPAGKSLIRGKPVTSCEPTNSCMSTRGRLEVASMRGTAELGSPHAFVASAHSPGRRLRWPSRPSWRSPLRRWRCTVRPDPRRPVRATCSARTTARTPKRTPDQSTGIFDALRWESSRRECQVLVTSSNTALDGSSTISSKVLPT